MDAEKYYREPFYAGDLGFQKMTMGNAKKMGHSFTYLSPAEVKAWYDLVKKPIHDKWIAEAEAKGLPAKAVYNETLKTETGEERFISAIDIELEKGMCCLLLCG